MYISTRCEIYAKISYLHNSLRRETSGVTRETENCGRDGCGGTGAAFYENVRLRLVKGTEREFYFEVCFAWLYTDLFIYLFFCSSISKAIRHPECGTPFYHHDLPDNGIRYIPYTYRVLRKSRVALFLLKPKKSDQTPLIERISRVPNLSG